MAKGERRKTVKRASDPADPGGAASGLARLRDVARESGCSATTASLALSGHPRISEKTRAKVRKVAEKLGYKPDLAARSLRQLRGRRHSAGLLGTLAMIVPGFIRADAPDGHLERWLNRFRNEAALAGYALTDFSAPAAPAQARALDRVLYHRGITGVIVAAANRVPEWSVDWDRYAIVANSWPHPCPFHSIGGDRFADLSTITRRLLELGFRRPGLIHPGPGFEGWLGGYSAALLDHKLAVPFPPLQMGGWDPASAARWIQKKRPDVMIANHGLKPVMDLPAFGIRIPDTLAYCSPDVLLDAEGLAGLRQPRPEVAKLTIDILHGQLRRHETGIPRKPLAIAIPPDWVHGFTLPETGRSLSGE